MERTESEEGNAALRPGLVGKHTPPGGSSDDPAYHALGFGTALQNGLDGAKTLLFPDQDLGAGQTFSIAVRFEAKVTVRNPGAIDEYRAFIDIP
jgi:hypothetical protein